MTDERKLLIATLLAVGVIAIVLAVLCTGLLGLYLDPEPEMDFIILPASPLW